MDIEAPDICDGDVVIVRPHDIPWTICYILPPRSSAPGRAGEET